MNLRIAINSAAYLLLTKLKNQIFSKMDIENFATKQDIRRLERLLKATLDELNEKVHFHKWVKKGKAAEILGISKRTLGRMRNRGEITFTRVGQTVFIDMISLYEVFEKNKIERLDL